MATEESTLHYYNTQIRPLTIQQISRERLQLFHLLNGDIFYPIRTWPINIQKLFWKKPIGDSDSFLLSLFFIGNGCPPHLISKWILTPQHWADYRKGEKRARQLDFITSNLTSKRESWFYFDLHNNEWLYLNGRKREKTW